MSPCGVAVRTREFVALGPPGFCREDETYVFLNDDAHSINGEFDKAQCSVTSAPKSFVQGSSSQCAPPDGGEWENWAFNAGLLTEPPSFVTRCCFCPTGVPAGIEICRDCAKHAYSIRGDDLSETEREEKQRSLLARDLRTEANPKSQAR